MLRVNDKGVAQRLDNYLLARLKGVPKGLVYRLIRQGHVRVNQRRAKAHHRLAFDDVIHLPELTQNTAHRITVCSEQAERFCRENTLYEDAGLLILNKPAGLAVHAGTGIRQNVIDMLRALGDDWAHADLVHRLDRDTSGCLVVAKKPGILKQLHLSIRQRRIKKRYLALVHGHWPKRINKVEIPLAIQKRAMGERQTVASDMGKAAVTTVQIQQRFDDYTLLSLGLVTGRMHQIRVHCQRMGHAIVGDRKYGDSTSLFPRLFLHAQRVAFEHPESGERIDVHAPYDRQFSSFLDDMTT